MIGMGQVFFGTVDFLNVEESPCVAWRSVILLHQNGKMDMAMPCLCILRGAQSVLLCGCKDLIQKAIVQVERHENLREAVTEVPIRVGANGQFDFSKNMPAGHRQVPGS